MEKFRHCTFLPTDQNLLEVPKVFDSSNKIKNFGYHCILQSNFPSLPGWKGKAYWEFDLEGKQRRGCGATVSYVKKAKRKRGPKPYVYLKFSATKARILHSRLLGYNYLISHCRTMSIRQFVCPLHNYLNDCFLLFRKYTYWSCYGFLSWWHISFLNNYPSSPEINCLPK